MKLITISEWDEQFWQRAEPIYDRAFPREGRKPDALIRRMLERGIGRLHLGEDGRGAVAMALTGVTEQGEALIIDYLAVRADLRGQGAGREFLALIRQWAEHSSGLAGIIIEVESDATPDNLARIAFWESCGFVATDYVHRYFWVPEPYRAMVLRFRDGDDSLPLDGELLFRHINAFHAKAYRKR
ncbi:MAG TPA: GNAT family N-acetyltransferase [Paenibacillus sp.]|uniref:GNAT family N-acetyltransferase n=1 Tax=Paenibacillus sp. TaxID=58172 RepID=UPI0028D50E88|nr:GNAT family N-acetyltransferase [Paenibacillus sp.]HUC90548.1 GNAT family N-acetyltransferase [Paenibacillus sp.]